MINRSSDDVGGLLGYIRGSTVEELFLINTAVIGSSAGGLVITASNAQIRDVFVQGTIKGTHNHGIVGGIAGQMVSGSRCQGCAVAGLVEGDGYVGGIIGRGGEIENSLSLVAVRSTGIYAAGVAGYNPELINNTLVLGPQLHRDSILSGYSSGNYAARNYWAVDTTGLTESGVSSSNQTDVEGVLLSELQCPTSANNTSCADVELFKQWDLGVNMRGEAYWDFGTSEQVPALNIAGKQIRDSDGDGTPDLFDDLPNQIAASKDFDKDGAIDAWSLACDVACRESSGLVLDQFVGNAAASVDLDLDGLPDQWNSACDSACQLGSGLTLDVFLDDFDNDGVVTALDADDDGDGVDDADADGDGYIDIATLAELDAVRFSLDGRGQRLTEDGFLDVSGCRNVIDGQLQRQCLGYELVADLDFDTNQNGVIDAKDTYWNEGEGWLPLSTNDEELTANIKGRGYTISNLMISRTSNAGLIGRMRGNIVEELFLINTSITGSSVGGIVVSAFDADIKDVFVQGNIKGTNDYGIAGGIAGQLVREATCRGCAVAGTVEGGKAVGGIVGTGSVENALSLATVRSLGYEVSGVTGKSTGLVKNTLVLGLQDHTDSVFNGKGFKASAEQSGAEQSYWAVDTTGFPYSGYSDSYLTDVEAALLSELQCPTRANNTTCADVELFKHWDLAKNLRGEAYWDFGTSEQAPGIRIAGRMIRDSDGDGAIDEYDDFPSQYEISKDNDSDGYADQFNDRCKEACQLNSALVLDQFPDNADEWIDTDADGIGNNADTDDDNDGVEDYLDAFPLNANESIDSDDDGFGNNEDVDDDNDMITDAWEESYGFDPLDANDALLDADNDGASNLDEFESGTDLRDGESVPDWLQGGGAWKYYLYKQAAEGAALQ